MVAVPPGYTPGATHVPPPAFTPATGIPTDRLYTRDEVMQGVRLATKKPYEMSGGAVQLYTQWTEHMNGALNQIRESDVDQATKERQIAAATQFYNRTLAYIGQYDSYSQDRIKEADAKRAAQGLAPGAWSNDQLARQFRIDMVGRLNDEINKDPNNRQAWNLVMNDASGPGLIGTVYDKKKGGIQWGGLIGALGGGLVMFKTLGKAAGGGIMGLIVGLLGVVGGAFAGQKIAEWANAKTNPTGPDASAGAGLGVTSPGATHTTTVAPPMKVTLLDAAKKEYAFEMTTKDGKKVFAKGKIEGDVVNVPAGGSTATFTTPSTTITITATKTESDPDYRPLASSSVITLNKPLLIGPDGTIQGTPADKLQWNNAIKGAVQSAMPAGITLAANTALEVEGMFGGTGVTGGTHATTASYRPVVGVKPPATQVTPA